MKNKKRDASPAKIGPIAVEIEGKFWIGELLLAGTKWVWFRRRGHVYRLPKKSIRLRPVTVCLGH